jgi:hypothetical protein
MLAHHTWLQPAPRLACGVFDYDCTSGPPQFSWRAVAASAVAAGVGQAVGGALGSNTSAFGPVQPAFSSFGDMGGAFARGAVSGLAAGFTASAVMAKGGKIDITRVAVDAFGQSLAHSIAGQIGQAGQQEAKAQQPQGQGPWSDYSYRNGGDIQDDLAGEARAFAALRAGGASDAFAQKIAPQYRELMADPQSRDLLAFGSRAAGGRSDRPQDDFAARIYDKVLGQQATLVGADIAKQQAYETSLLAPIVQHVNAMDAFISGQGVARVSESLFTSRQTMAAALTAKDVYYDTSISELLPNTITKQQVLDFNGPNQSGLYGATYSDSISGKTFVAMRGTEFGIPGRFETDLAANAIQLLGAKADQYEQAIDWATKLSLKTGASNLIFTGHSLGGGLASAMANVVSGSQGITFNSAGLHANSLPSGFTPSSSANLQAYYVKGELISTSQDNAGVLRAGVTAFPPTREYGLLLQSIQAGPGAAGQRIALDAVTAPDRITATSSFGGRAPEVSYSPMLPFSGGPGDMLTLHGQTQVLFSLSRNYQSLTYNNGQPNAWRSLLKY